MEERALEIVRKVNGGGRRLGKSFVWAHGISVKWAGLVKAFPFLCRLIFQVKKCPVSFGKPGMVLKNR